MCETMTNIPVEDNTSYVLTEDMIDAAMTEQYAFQDGIESEGELTSSENSMNVDLDAQVTVIPESNIRSVSSLIDAQRKEPTDSNETSLDRSSGRVVVIETGLDKSNRVLLDNNDSGRLSSTTEIAQATGNKADGTTITHCRDRTNTPNETICNTDQDSENFNAIEEDKEPILKSILNSSVGIESIDLCNSDTDEMSEDGATEGEMLDNELQSVMESNMMAEVGLAADNKHPDSVGKFKKSIITMSSPKLQVKSITQISPSTFNNMSHSTQLSKTHKATIPIPNNRGDTNSKTEENIILKGFRLPNFVVKPKDQTIHLNRIAIPHQNFYSSQGQKMKCVYLKSASGAPVVINSRQQPSTSQNSTTYVKAQQLNKPAKLSPTELFSNVKKRQLQFNQPIVQNNQAALPTKQLVLPVSQSFSTTNQFHSPNKHQTVTNNQHNMLSYQSNQIKPNSLLTTPKPVTTAPQRILAPISTPNHQDERVVALVKSLLFDVTRKPYSPPEVAQNVTLHKCLDCHDRFIIQSSLMHHLARRSLLIRYWCQTCSTELNFFNKCLFMGHLRSHNYPISQLDYSKISVEPVSVQMIQSGIVSTFFKESLNNSCLPYEECIISKPGRGGLETAKQVNLNTSFCDKSLNTSSKNISPNNKRAISTDTQSRISVLLSKNNTSQFTCTSSAKEVSLMPTATSLKNPTLPSVTHLKTYSKKTSADNTKAVPKKLVLVLDKQNKPVNVKLNSKVNVLPPNELFSVSESIIIDDNSLEQPTLSKGVEEVDIGSVLLPNGSCTTSSSPVNSKSKNTSNNKVKQINRPALPAKPLPEKLLKKLCTECGVSCLNIGKHLTGCGRPIYPQLLSCERCDLILPTKCALKCHLRIHDNLPPYKCPDCGKDFTIWSDLYSHLKMSCGHFAKCVRYSCYSCKKHFASKSFLAVHISTHHSRDIFRCSACPVAFYNKPAADKHMATTVHKEEKVVFLNQKQCDMCPKKLIPLEEFESHVQNHTDINAAAIYGFKCPWCSLVYENKMEFIIHQVKEKKEMENSTNTMIKKKFLRLLSLDSETNRQETNKKETPRSDFEFVEQFPNLELNLSAAEKDPLSSDDWELFQDQRAKEKKEDVCIVCKKNSVVLLHGVNVNQKSLFCKMCVKTLDVQSRVQNGQTLTPSTAIRPSVSDKKLITSTSMNYEGTLQALETCTQKVGKRSYSGEKTSTRPKKKQKSSADSSRLGPDKESNMNSHSTVIMPVKKRDKKIKAAGARIDFGGQSSQSQGQIIDFQSPELVCAKCKFFADSKETFLEHIAGHRIDPNTYQCLECGLCFVVLPSLERHLRMNHGIKDVYEYTDKNKSSVPKKAHVEETECLKENQCRVCLEIYDSNSSLEKHFRTHGMAFMSSLSKSP